MNKIKNIYISYWYQELNFNPAKKINLLEKEITSIIDAPLMYNNDNNLNNISMPRIQGLSNDKKYLFTMSLVNAFLSINITDDMDDDEILLLINNNIQLFYDILNNVYDAKILYTSIKLESIDESSNHKEKLIKLLNLPKETYEELSFKRGMIKDDYYINYIISYTKEYNFNVLKKDNATEQDLFDRSMITSLANATLNKEFLLTIVEINDRYAYNKNPEYCTTKENIRGMIIELKKIINNKLYYQL